VIAINHSNGASAFVAVLAASAFPNDFHCPGIAIFS
jgi:hypothetical protein